MRGHKTWEWSSFHTKHKLLVIVTILVRQSRLRIKRFHFASSALNELVSSFVILSNHAALGLSGTHTSINEEFWMLTSCHEDVLVIVHLGLLVFNYAEIIPSSSI